MPQSFTDRSKSADLATGKAVETRLDGWKDIATYLGRAERTVKRWEADRGLPTHRVPGGGRAAVHAYKDELDRWLKSNSELQTSESSRQAESSEASKIDSEQLDEAVSAPAALAAKTKPPRSIPRVVWLPAFCGLLLAGIVLSAMPRASFVRNSSPRGQSSTVSDSEKAVAHDLYLKGRFEWNKRTAESLNQALDDFTQSIVHDPTSARNYAGLADTYTLMHEYSMMPAQEAYSRAIAAATKAVELDDALAEAHRSLAFAEVWGNWDFQTGKREFLRAIALDPNDALTHLWFATAFEGPAWYSFTAQQFARAQELDPASEVVIANKSIWLSENGQRQSGIELARSVERMDPDFVAPHRYLARMFWDAHDYSNFLLESEKTAELTHDEVLTESTAAARAGFARGSETGLLNDLYLSQKRQHENGKLPGTTLAQVAIRIGRREEALQLIQEDFDHKGPGFLAVITIPDFRAFQGDPRFDEMMRKLNIPPPPATSR